MTNRDPLLPLLVELSQLAMLGARQSTALGNLLIAKGLVTRDECDQYMRLSAEVTKKVLTLLQEWEDRTTNQPPQ